MLAGLLRQGAPARRVAMARAASTITMDSAGKLRVPDDPILPFVIGDGTGPDIWNSSVAVFDAAVEKAYKGKRKITVSE